MNRVKAIEVLKPLINSYVDHANITMKEEDDDIAEALEMAVESLKSLPSALNNQVNLCDSCTYTYPECPSEKDDVIFGNGIGNDNICACNKYQPTIQPEGRSRRERKP